MPKKLNTNLRAEASPRSKRSPLQRVTTIAIKNKEVIEQEVDYSKPKTDVSINLKGILINQIKQQTKESDSSYRFHKSDTVGSMVE